MAANTIAFRAALVRIGFDASSQNAIVSRGFTRMSDLNLVGKDDVKRICKIIKDNDNIVIAFMQQQSLEAMRYWVSSRTRRGIDTSANLFNRDVADEQIEKMLVDFSEASDKTDISPKTMPDKFKNEGNWTIFKDALNTYLSQIKGGDRIPLNYVIRDRDVPDPTAVYASELEHLTSTVPLSGEHYNRDNIKVYGIIKSLALEGPGWNWIIHLDREQNGRNAWKALTSHYEGDSMQSRTVDEAYKNIANAHYSGERRNFTFETFTNIHQRAHQDLKRLGEIVTEKKKVRDFINNIHDPNLGIGKANVLAHAPYSNDFTLASNYLSNFVVRFKSNAAVERRGVSALEAGRGRFSRGGCGRGRGRGRGREGRGNRGGRSYGGDVTNRHYPPAEWAKLSYEDKTKVLEMRENNKKRKSSAVTTLVAETANNNPNDNDGDQFGRQVHNKH
ncbi:MAG: hypothetical protein ACREBR_00785 [bacterium]